jgi:hypothetical protein
LTKLSTGRARKSQAALAEKERSRMGFIEQGRQLIQDFVTPEIRSIDTRLIAVEKRIESLDASNDKRFTMLDTRVEKVQTTLETKIEKVQPKLEKKIDHNCSQGMETLRRIETSTKFWSASLVSKANFKTLRKPICAMEPS